MANDVPPAARAGPSGTIRTGSKMSRPELRVGSSKSAVRLRAPSNIASGPSGLARRPSRASFGKHRNASSAIAQKATKQSAFKKLFGKKEPQMTARVATLDDIEDLLKIERSAFPNPDHQASRETITRRLTTSPGSHMVAVHPELGIVGSVYTKLCNAEVIMKNKYPWEVLNNGGDFTPPKDFDSAYVIGLQTMRGVRNVSKTLELYALEQAIKLGCKQCFGGPRLPGYSKYFKETGKSVDEYIATGQDKVLSTITRNATVPGVFKCKAVAHLVNYWDDPDSMNFAALIKVSWSPLLNKVPGLSSLVFKAAKAL